MHGCIHACSCMQLINSSASENDAITKQQNRLYTTVYTYCKHYAIYVQKATSAK